MTQFSGWSGYWADFLKLEKETFIEELSQYCRTWDWTKDVSIQQVNAWKHEFDVMQQTLSNVLQETGSEFADQAWISFEHELFGESGKRAADVNLVLPSCHLFLIEFKHKKQASDKEIIRVAFDLAAMLRFHSESIQLDGRAYLVFSREDAQAFKDNHVECDVAVQQRLPKLQQALIEASQ